MIDKFAKLFDKIFQFHNFYKNFIKQDKIDHNHYEIKTHIRHNDGMPSPTYHLYNIFDKKEIFPLLNNFQYYDDLFNDGKLFIVLESKYKPDLLEYWELTYNEITKVINHKYYSKIKENIFFIIYYNNQWLEYKDKGQIIPLPPIKID